VSEEATVALRYLSVAARVVVPSSIEVIAARAFGASRVANVMFESGKIREIRENAFAGCASLKAFTVPQSVEEIGEGCFENCDELEIMAFEEPSRLKRINARVFAGCALNSIAIPESTTEIDGSAFVGCPLREIRVVHFIVRGDMLLTADCRQIVRYFGLGKEVVVPASVELLGRSCFQDSRHLQHVIFENGSRLRRIGVSAFADCENLAGIVIPASVEIIEDEAFKGCSGMEGWMLDEEAALVMIGKKAIAECRSLRSFAVPAIVESIGQGCFAKCFALFRLRFGSANSLKRVVGEMKLDDALEHFGFDEISSLFRIEVTQGGLDLEFPGWSSVVDADSHLIIVEAI
jgi:hypothetical protein